MKYYFLLILCSFSTLVLSQVKRIDPPNWWAGMKNSEVQLLVYGEDISALTPKIEKEGVLVESKRVENPNYLFITLNLANEKAGKLTIDFFEGKNKVQSVAYEILDRKERATPRGFDSSDLIYLLMPDRFANGNPANDSHPEMKDTLNRVDKDGRHGGDIQGIINHLDYIKELGATAIWSTPLCEDNDKRVSYHTYAQSDVYRIDPRYGSVDDYKNLSAELHKREMKLIMDYVSNHWGLESWIIKDIPTKDWIHQHDTYTETNHRKELYSDPYASEIDYKELEEGWFVPSMPDLNQGNPLVLNYLTQNAIWWIETANLDGFRVDTYPYNDPNAMVKWVQVIMDEYPNFNIVGEGWMHNTIHTSYWQKDSPVAAIQGFNSLIPTVMDFPLTDALNVAFNENNSHWDKGTVRFYKNFQNDFLYPNPNNVMVFVENHDTNRINDTYPEFEKYKMVMTVLATVRGIPQIYYGSEIGMAGKKEVGDGDIRRDFPGGWDGDSQNAFTKKGRTDSQEKYFSFTKKLFQWRKNKSVIHTGKTMHYIPQNDVYVYFRYNEKETVMVILNNNLESQTIDLGRFKERIQHFTFGKDVLKGEKIPLTKEMTLKPQTATIIELY